MGLILRHAHRMTHSAAEILREHGLTPARYQLLLQLREGPDVHQQDLGSALGVTKGNVSMLLSELERAGLVSRTPDGSANRILLTARGEALADALVPDQREWTHRQFAGLATDDLQRLILLLRQLPA